MIKFSPQQESALQLIKAWHGSGARTEPFVLNGYAGTGKTTIARHIHDTIGASNPREVVYVAFTGKAALQLRNKGCKEATTIHKLLYSPIDKGRKELKRLQENLERLKSTDPNIRNNATRQAERAVKAERERVAQPSFQNKTDQKRLNDARLIIVDESSMIDAKIAFDLRDTGIPIIYCGDPFQLPPVMGKSPISELPVNITLTEVHRQALESPVLFAATELRMHGRLPPSSCKGDEEFAVVDLADANYDLYAGHDQVLCGRNNTRTAMNKRMQAQKHARGELVKNGEAPIGPGDKVVFLRNDYDANIFNGTIGMIDEAKRLEESEMMLAGTCDGEPFKKYKVWTGLLEGKHASEAPQFSQRADLAYALTVHKAQGSEWDSVLIHHEPIGGDSDRERWTYTALTRARRRCTIVMRK